MAHERPAGSAVTDSIIDHAVAMADRPLPPGPQRATVRLLLDAIGVGIAGGSTPESRALLAVARGWGYAGEASVWGVDQQLPAVHAALVNGHQMHCLEFDAIHEPSVVHPMTVVFPVLAAFVQRSRGQGRVFSGMDFLRAIAIGVDVAAGLGDVVTSPLQFFRPATAGNLGAIAALTTLTHASSELARAAFGVAYSGLSGTMQPHHEGEGSQVLALQIGYNARAALSSWDLAEAGFRGPRQVLEGVFGYFRLIEASGRPELLAERFGHQWEVERTSIKPFPSGRATHAVLDAVLTLQRQYGFVAGDVQRIEARVPSMVHALVGRAATLDLVPSAARLCLPYLVAYSLRHGDVRIDAYSEANLRDSKLFEAAQRVVVIVDDNDDPNAFDPQTVLVELRDGRTLDLTLPRSLGSPPRPMTEAQHERKFRANLESVRREDRVQPLLDLVARVTDLEDVCALIEAM